jgi:hypothetical protein
MALVIEDGSGVTGANSYISEADARTYASDRGLTLPAAGTGTDPLIALLIKAKDYIESFRAEFQGVKAASTNPLQWPRSGAYLDGYLIGDDEVPDVLPQAQAQLAIDAYNGGVAQDLMPSSDGREVVAEAVEGAVSVQYAQNGDNNPQPMFTAARALLEPLLRSSVGGGALVAIRV